ncbi:MAG: endolytic transglycosylase MltG [Chlorobiaceae bacterium]|nr:endolytic transglycosylase MltG [Chlorobiaceae bacterium]NTW73342.1 endolytic transglycosylase MltG [Chlorobiaceae bacterium]
MPRRKRSGPGRTLKATALAMVAILAMFIFVPGANSVRWSGAPVNLNIHRGTGFRQIVEKLHQSGIVRFRWPLLVAGTLLPDLHKIKPGRYAVPVNLSTFALLQHLHSSPQDEVRLMIPNGVEQERLAGIIAANLDIDSTAFMAATNDRALLSSLGIDARNTEGYLFPGTYNFPWASTPREVIAFLAGRFRSYYADSLRREASAAGLSENRLLTLASIVEAETPIDSEKALIASVYLNRLRKNMRLQADPTVQYAIPGPSRRLYYKDLAFESPYNTYRHAGLPPGPICNPGAASLKAVLRPANTGFIYFVANGEGGHSFAATLAAHEQNIRRYQASLRARSGPPPAQAPR